MKRSRHVTLILVGTGALAGCTDEPAARPPPDRVESLALPAPGPRCDRPEDFPLPECHDPARAAAAGPPPAQATSSGPRGVFFFLSGHRGSYGPSTPAARTYAATGAAVRAAAPAGVTTYGGFGGTGRAAAAFGGGE